MTYRTLAAALMVGAISISCGSPTSPTPPVTPPVITPPVVVNTPPIILKFTVQGTRANEPANFADLSEDLPITVDVSDAESAVTALKFNWSSNFGTFTGIGNRVTWRSPSSISGTPANVILNLEVVETYTSAGKSVDNKVTGSTQVSLHDSAQEVGDMARQFLLDFSDSSIRDIPYIMRNFEPTCYGTADETGDVTKNRTDFTIQPGWRVENPITTVAFGGSCPFRAPGRPGDACAQVRTFWKSVANKDLFDGTVLALHKGDTTFASGVDQVAAKYYKDQQRWRLCASDFNGDAVAQTSLLPNLRGLVP